MNKPSQTNRPMRADAQRNYASLLNTARVAVSEHGADIVLEDIARSAGVGIGTLYRHFPTRQDLLEAVFLDETNELRARAKELASAPVPFDALMGWLRLQMDFAAHGRSMGAAIMAAKYVLGTWNILGTKKNPSTAPLYCSMTVPEASPGACGSWMAKDRVTDGAIPAAGACASAFLSLQKASDLPPGFLYSLDKSITSHSKDLISQGARGASYDHRYWSGKDQNCLAHP